MGYATIMPRKRSYEKSIVTHSLLNKLRFVTVVIVTGVIVASFRTFFATCIRIGLRIFFDGAFFGRSDRKRTS